MLKISLLDKVYTITTDEDDRFVLQATDRVNELLKQQDAQGRRLVNDVEKNVLLAMLQLAIDLEKVQSELEAFNQKVSSLSAIVSPSL